MNRAVIRPIASIISMMLTLSLLASSDSPSAEALDFFERKIRPVLVDRCYECHTGKEKGGLRLDSRQRLLQGGDSGAAITPGKPETSLLVEAIHYGADSYQMPPKEKLPDHVINDFERWIGQGAPWPEEDAVALGESPVEGFSITAEQRAFWAFQPVEKIDAPPVADRSWPRNDLDHFILHRLEKGNLKPTAPAGKRALLRRATFDLTGLPPTPEEVQSFLADDSKDAFARVVDRLLDSPRYGEHWARHWLDGVRYVSDLGYYNFSDLGWRYRDWVIRALNHDLPYDEFVIHQIAGDLMPRSSKPGTYADGIIATGVLAMGNYDDQESDKEKLYAEVIDDQIDLVSRQFLGLTISCARCHDHKFDPISTEDYYSLGGIFLSSRVLDTGSRIGAHRIKVSLDSPEQRQHRELIKQTEEQIKQREKEEAGGEQITSLRRKLELLKKDLQPDAGEAIAVQEGGYDNSRHKNIGDMPIYIRGNPYKLGKMAPRGFPRIFAEDNQVPISQQTSQSGRLELARWIASPRNPLTARVMVNRLWQYHFGRGLVRTASNFGKMGEKPSHPELLDYLADRFVKTKWSIKAMHRLLMNSATYQQASTGVPATVQADPENILWGRFTARRLAAEEIYDSLLAVSGKLQAGIGQGQGNRAVYSRVGHEYSFLVASLFDAPPTGTIVPVRNQSTTAPQALYMMNDSSVISASQALASRLGAYSGDEEVQIGLAYQMAYARSASERELGAGLAFLGQLPKEQRWTYFQVLLCGSEFIYLD